MRIVLLAVMFVLPVLYGRGILGIFYGRRQQETFTVADCLAAGLAVMVGLAEVFHLCAVFLKVPFSRCTMWFGEAGLLLAGLSLAVCICRQRALAGGAASGQVKRMQVKLTGSGYPWGKAEKILAGIFGLLVLSQVIFLLAGGGLYRQGDMTVETVGSFLYADQVYQVNPLTGNAYQGGIPVRLKILCLPSLYGMLCRLFSLDPGTVVWWVMPLVTLACSYGAFYNVGRCLFPGDRKKLFVFLSAVALLMWAGDYRFGMDGFGLLHSGWQGVVIRNLVLLPWLVSLCMRRKWMAVLLCVAAEACMVWTLYGMGVCALAAPVYGLCIRVGDKGQKAAGARKGGDGL